MKPKALVLQARGTNRDYDVMQALELAGAEPVGVPLNDLRAGRGRWADYQLLVVPGGFSYADALGAGKLLAVDLNSYFAEEIRDFVAAGKPVIGICNGFQALVKSGILPGANVVVATAKHPVRKQTSEEIASQSARDDPRATLTFNASGHFECRWVSLQPVSQTCLWTKDLTGVIECPVAHGEGNFQVSGESYLSSLSSNDQVALTYVCPDGSPAHGDYPANPNGSALDIAGLCNPQGNVLGLMPHPENHVFPYQHPRRTRGVQSGSGLPLFVNGVTYASS
jgi:phosphoribosylformylglycinamidine synthase I